VDLAGLHYRQAMHPIHFPAWDFLRAVIRECAISLARADRAMKEAKALDQLREGTSSIYGIEEMQIEESDREQITGDVNITFSVSRLLSSQEQSLIYRTLDEVNRRFGTRIHATIVSQENRAPR